MDFHNWTHIGGLKLEQDDFLFEQNAIRKTFLGLLSMIESGDDKGYILSGCERDAVSSPGFIDFSAGWFVLNGEIYEVEAHQVPDNGNTEYWEVFEEADPAGDEIFEDTVSRSTYIKRRARVAESASPPATYTPSVAPSVFQKLSEDAALGTASLAQVVADNTAEINGIKGAWSVYNITAGDLERIGSSEDLTNVFGTIRYKVVGKTMHYNLSLGGDMPSNSSAGIDFAGIAGKLGITLPGADQPQFTQLSEAAGAEIHTAYAVWNSATGLSFNIQGGTTLNTGNTVLASISGSIELN